MNTLGYEVAQNGPGSEGQETDKFDDNLRKALKVFQDENNLPITGDFDKATFTLVNKMIDFLNKPIDQPATTTERAKDVYDIYSGDPDMDKDFFASSSDKTTADYFKAGEKDVNNYKTDSLKSYDDSDALSSYVGKSNDPSTLTLTNGAKAVMNAATKVVTQSTGNPFQDVMLVAILKNASKLFLGEDGVMRGLQEYSVPVKKVDDGAVKASDLITDEEFQATLKNVLNEDGTFNAFKCMRDPVCSRF